MSSASTSKPSSGSLDLQNFPKSNQYVPILQNAQETSNKMVHKKRHHFLAQIFIHRHVSHLFVFSSRNDPSDAQNQQFCNNNALVTTYHHHPIYVVCETETTGGKGIRKFCICHTVF